MHGPYAQNSCSQQMVAEEPLVSLEDLAGGVVLSVEAHPSGWSMKFSNGDRIVVATGATLDGAGNPVIEPSCLESANG